MKKLGLVFSLCLLMLGISAGTGTAAPCRQTAPPPRLADSLPASGFHRRA